MRYLVLVALLLAVNVGLPLAEHWARCRRKP